MKTLIALLLTITAASAQYRWVSTQLGTNTAIITASSVSNQYSGVEVYASKNVAVEFRFKLLTNGTSNAVFYFAPANTANKYDSNRIWTVTVPATGTNEVIYNTNFDMTSFRYFYWLTASNGNSSTLTNLAVTTGYKFGL